MIGGANQANWERIADVLGHPEWKTDPRYATNADRKEHEAELAEEIAKELKAHTTEEWIKKFDAVGIPAGPVNNIEQALNHPQTIARDMVVEVEHPIAGKGHSLNLPIKLSDSPAQINRPAPLLGENTREILREYGFLDGEVDDLLNQGVVAEPSYEPAAVRACSPQEPERPVRTGLATDVGGGTSLSMLKTMGEAYKVGQFAGNSLSAPKAFWLATAGSARALHLENHVGTIAIGMEADLQVLNLRSTPLIDFRMRYCNSLQEALFIQMTLADERAVQAVYISGNLKFSG